MLNLRDLFIDFLRTAPTEEINDFRSYQNQLLPPAPPKKRVGVGRLLPPPTRAPYVQAEQLPLGQLSDLRLQQPLRGSNPDFAPQYDNSDLPQVPPPPMDPQRARIINQRQNTRELSDPNDPNFRKVVNNDRGWKGRLADILRQFVISAGQSYDKSDPRLAPQQRLLGALGGGIAGGTYAGFHPEVDEERQRMYDINQSKAKEAELVQQMEQEQATFKRQQEALARQQGLIVNQPVQVIDPITGQPVYVKGSEAYSQGQQAVRQQAGFENQAASQKRGQDFSRIENQKTRDSNYAIAVANAQTAADKERINNEIQADRDHASALEKFYTRKTERLLEISKLAASVKGAKTISDSTLTQVQTNLDRARELDDQIQTELSKDSGFWGSGPDKRLISDLTKQRDALIKQAEDETSKLTAEAVKAGVSAAQVETLQKANQEDRYPTRRTVPTYRPTVPQRPGQSGGYSAAGKVYPSPSALRGAFPNLTEAQIRQLIESQGGRFEQ